MVRAALLLIVTTSIAACSQPNHCPTIDCVSRIDLTFANPVPNPYRPSVTVGPSTFVANCPMALPAGDRTPQIQSCDDHQITLTGIDLGHFENTTLFLTVTLTNATPLTVIAALQGIANSIECQHVCFEYAATVPN